MPASLSASIYTEETKSKTYTKRNDSEKQTGSLLTHKKTQKLKLGLVVCYDIRSGYRKLGLIPAPAGRPKLGKLLW